MADYSPFHDRKHFLRSALIDALSWEESRVDAGCDMDEKSKKHTADKIKLYRRELNKLQPGAKTPQQALNDHIDELLNSGYGKMMTMSEIKKEMQKRKNKNG